MAIFNHLNLAESYVGLGRGKHFLRIPNLCLELEKDSMECMAYISRPRRHFRCLMGKPETLHLKPSHGMHLERVIVLVYSKYFNSNSANEARKLFFTQSLRVDSRFAPSQWETALLCNDVSHWLGASLESALVLKSLNSTPSIKRTLFQHARHALLNAAFNRKQSFVKGQWVLILINGGGSRMRDPIHDALLAWSPWCQPRLFCAATL